MFVRWSVCAAAEVRDCRPEGTLDGGAGADNGVSGCDGRLCPGGASEVVDCASAWVCMGFLPLVEVSSKRTPRAYLKAGRES